MKLIDYWIWISVLFNYRIDLSSNTFLGAEIEKVLSVIPRERNTFLFSATMTTKVEKLQRASLVNPAKIQVATK
jgi:hypothetical protein